MWSNNKSNIWKSKSWSKYTFSQICNFWISRISNSNSRILNLSNNHFIEFNIHLFHWNRPPFFIIQYWFYVQCVWPRGLSSTSPPPYVVSFSNMFKPEQSLYMTGTKCINSNKQNWVATACKTSRVEMVWILISWLLRSQLIWIYTVFLTKYIWL